MEAYIRAATMKAISYYNEKINRAFAAAAAAIGCGLEIKDLHGYAPRPDYRTFGEILLEAAKDLLPEGKARYDAPFTMGCTDIGDVAQVMPSLCSRIGGYSGVAHSSNMYISNPYLATVVSAKIQAEAAVKLLEDGAVRAKSVLAEFQPVYGSIAEYLEAVEKLTFTAQAVRYDENGDVILHYRN